MQSLPFGFLIRGSCRNARKLVDVPTAFSGYANCLDAARVDNESYLSAFQFDEEFRQRDDGWQVSVRGFDGACWSQWIWFDIDREGDLDRAVKDTRRLASFLADRYRLDGDDLLLFFSGSKGFHIGVPSSLWQPEPSVEFNKFARRFAESLAEMAGIEIDSGVYDKVRAFRAPNSRHAKTGLHKRRLLFDELLHLKPSAILELAKVPQPFEIPESPSRNERATNDWQNASKRVSQEAAAIRERHQQSGSASMNRRTLEFIRNGATTGDRHRLLFSAAANLAEFDCPPQLAHALLTESALDSSLSPQEVHRQIECGLNHARSDAPLQDATGMPQVVADDGLGVSATARDTDDSGPVSVQMCQQLSAKTSDTDEAL